MSDDAKKKAKKTKTGAKAGKPEVEPAATTRLARQQGSDELARQPAEAQRFAASVVPEANRKIRALGLQHESLSQYLFEQLFGKEPHTALEPESRLGARYLALRERAGKSLRLDPAELLKHVRVGAIAYLRGDDDDVWAGLDWSEKVELLPLLALNDGRKVFNQGVVFASRSNAGKLRVRAWVQEHTPRLPGSVGRPRGETLTLSKGGKFAETGIKLGDPKQRTLFVERLRDAPAEKRRALVRDLRKAQANLASLLDEIDDIDK